MAHNLGKFILGYCMKFDCGSLFYIGRIWLERNISLYSELDGSQAPLGSKTLSFTNAATNIEVIAS